MGRRQLVGFTVLLGVMITVGPATIDMYLPSLPRIATELSASDAAVALTLTGTMIGMALGQLVTGPLSDAVGRRRPLLIGLAVHVLASIAILFTHSVGVLGCLRVLQGFGAAASSTIAMAVVRDLFTGVRVAQVLSRLMLVMGLAPILAPSIGSAILRFTGWRMIFVVLAAISTGVVLASARFLPETLPAHRRRPASIVSLAATFGTLVRDRVFVGLVAVSGLTFAALFTYVSGSSFVLQQAYGLDEQQFGLAFSGGAVGMIVMTQVNVPLLRRFAPGQLLIAGLVGCLACSGVLVLTAATGAGGLVGVLLPIWASMAFLALTFPNTPAIALSRHGEAAGTAAAALGCVQNLVGALAAPVVGLLGTATAVPMAAVMSTLYGIALLVLLVGVRARRLHLPVELADEPVQYVH
jgi:DHA1 family bicyclomycin/chloramphenicol resistance-like MFS transporter